MHIGLSKSHLSRDKSTFKLIADARTIFVTWIQIKYPTNSNALRFAFFFFIFTFSRCRPAFFAQSATNTSVTENVFQVFYRNTHLQLPNVNQLTGPPWLVHRPFPKCCIPTYGISSSIHTPPSFQAGIHWWLRPAHLSPAY